MPKGHSGIKRGGTGITTPAKDERTIVPNREALVASSPDSVRQLEILASKGVMPDRIVEGSREERERIYEAIDRLYPAPPGEMNNYDVIQRDRRHIEVRFRQNMMEAESPPQLTLTRPEMSERARAGLIKQAIYRQRAAVEVALSTRKSGFPTYEMADKYGRKILSNSEKAQVDREIGEFVQSMLKTPMSSEGREIDSDMWIRVSGGWERHG